MKFKKLSFYLEDLDKTASRICITEILASLFKESKANEIDKVVYLLLGTLAPNYRRVVFNVAERMMLQVAAKAYNKDLNFVKEDYKKRGDIGDVVYSLAKKSKGKSEKLLSVTEIYESLLKVAQDEGEGSQERKVSKLAELLSILDPMSAKYVARIPVGKLRLGFSDKTVLDGLSWMERGDKSGKDKLDKAYHVLPDVGLLAKGVKEKGIEKATENITPQVGVPVLPMLAQRLKKPSEMIEKMGKVAVEPKLDGLRIQIHHKKGKDGFTKVYTRNLNETSWMFPELKEIGKFIKAKEVILDTEAIGVDEERQKLANFQATMTRRRKHEIDEYQTKVPIKFFVFDILCKNGKDCMDGDYRKRRSILEKTVKRGKLFEVVDYTITDNPEEIIKLNTKWRKEGLEGIVVKRVDSGYVPGRTGWRWVKMKEAQEAEGKLADTLDCIIMGYSVGKGRRAGFGIGQFLAGIIDKGKVKTITKVGTGLTDEQFSTLIKKLNKLVTDKKPKEYDVHKDYEPDYWVEPKVVVEIAADELTKSPRHTSGMALRFPRLVKFREDKSLKQITTKKEIIKLFSIQ